MNNQDSSPTAVISFQLVEYTSRVWLDIRNTSEAISNSSVQLAYAIFVGQSLDAAQGIAF